LMMLLILPRSLATIMPVINKENMKKGSQR
jgi:hypothetical protein